MTSEIGGMTMAWSHVVERTFTYNSSLAPLCKALVPIAMYPYFDECQPVVLDWETFIKLMNVAGAVAGSILACLVTPSTSSLVLQSWNGEHLGRELRFLAMRGSFPHANDIVHYLTKSMTKPDI